MNGAVFFVCSILVVLFQLFQAQSKMVQAASACSQGPCPVPGMSNGATWCASKCFLCPIFNYLIIRSQINFLGGGAKYLKYFGTCSNGCAVFRQCGAGTSCKKNGNSITCGWWISQRNNQSIRFHNFCIKILNKLKNERKFKREAKPLNISQKIILNFCKLNLLFDDL